MKNPVESLLEDDHASLGQLLTELDAELAKPNIARAFELLDLFWARSGSSHSSREPASVSCSRQCSRLALYRKRQFANI